MDNAKFLSILNRAVRESGLDLAAPAAPADPAVVAAWAELLRRCVASGVSIADPRWREVEIRVQGGTAQFALGKGTASDASGDETDFTLGLSLLVSLLGRKPDRDDA